MYKGEENNVWVSCFSRQSLYSVYPSIYQVYWASKTQFRLGNIRSYFVHKRGMEKECIKSRVSRRVPLPSHKQRLFPKAVGTVECVFFSYRITQRPWTAHHYNWGLRLCRQVYVQYTLLLSRYLKCINPTNRTISVSNIILSANSTDFVLEKLSGKPLFVK